MADTLFVFYSLEGNTAFVAEIAEKAAEMDVERLMPEKEPPKKGAGKFFWGGKSVVFNEKPKLAPLKYELSGYTDIIIGFPVWAGSYPPAIASYINDNDLSGKKVYIIACSAGGNAEKAIKKLTDNLPGSSITDSLSLTDPIRDKETNSKLITDFIEKNFSSR